MLLQPVPRPRWPKFIATVRILTGVQVALVMIFGNCSFGIPLFAAFAWPAERFNWNVDPVGLAILGAWSVGLAAILTYAYFTNRWAGEGDRRARTTITIGTTMLVVFTAATIPIAGWDPGWTMITLLTASPSLIIQASVLRYVYGPEGRRWFEGSGVTASSSSAGD